MSGYPIYFIVRSLVGRCLFALAIAAALSLSGSAIAAEPAGSPANTIERPEFRAKNKPIAKTQSSVRAMVVTTTPDWQMLGRTLEVIATARILGPNQGPGELKFTRPVGQEMSISAQEAMRAIQVRYPNWQAAEIQLSFEEKYSPKDGGSAGTAFALLLLSLLEDIALDPAVAMTGDITVDWKVRNVGGVPAKVRGALLDGCKYAAIPTERANDLYDMVLLHPPETLSKIQVFGIETLHDAVALARKDRAPDLAAAIERFEKVQQELERSADALTSESTRAALEEVLKLAPNHLTARSMLEISKGNAPKTLTLTASIDEVMGSTAPVRSFMWGGSEAKLGGPEDFLAAQRRLQKVRPILHPDSHRLCQSLMMVMSDGRKLAELDRKAATATTVEGRNRQLFNLQAQIKQFEPKARALANELNKLSSDSAFWERVTRGK